MQIDEFQTRLRAIYEATLAVTVEAKRVQDEALDALFSDVEAADSPSAAELGPVVNAEFVRMADRIRAAGVEV